MTASRKEIMIRSFKFVVSTLVLLVTVMGTAWAAETREEKDLSKEAAAISATAKNAQGEKVVTGRLEKEFNVTESQIQALRDKKLGYGEISIVLSMASKMPGGATDVNIGQIMTLRQGPPRMGWGGVCTKLGPMVSQMKTMNRETHQEMMHEAKGGKEQHHERHDEQHREMMGHEGMGGMGGGEGAHGKGH
jgi:hypothetical protein